MELLVTVLIFGAAMLGMSLGVLLTGKKLEGSCRAAADGPLADEIECGACTRKDAELCPGDDELVRIAQLGHPDPKHHR